jgi:predicted component of type VI protein secretion system
MEKKLRTLITQLVNEEISLMEKKRKKDEAPSEENVELNLDMPAEEPAAEPTTEPAAEPTTEPDMDLSGGDSTEKRIGQGLQMALDAAKEMPDGENKTKLVRQIGNTALFFLKTQIPGTGDQV